MMSLALPEEAEGKELFITLYILCFSYISALWGHMKGPLNNTVKY